MLAIYGPTVGVDPNWYSHDLVALWEAFAELLKRYGTSDPVPEARGQAPFILPVVLLGSSAIPPRSRKWPLRTVRQTQSFRSIGTRIAERQVLGKASGQRNDLD